MKALIISFIGVLLTIAIVYATLIYLKGEKEMILAEMAANDSTLTTEKPLSEADSLRKIVEMNGSEVIKKETKMDSLKNNVKRQVQIARKETIENGTLNQSRGKSEKARSMAKTFEKMSVKQIAPILRNLDDKTVMLIYSNTGNRFKKNILLAVSEKRAALITKEFINN